MGKYILKIRDTDVRIEVLRDPVEYKESVQRVFASDRLGSFRENRNSFYWYLVLKRSGVAYGLTGYYYRLKLPFEGSFKGQNMRFLLYGGDLFNRYGE